MLTRVDLDKILVEIAYERTDPEIILTDPETMKISFYGYFAIDNLTTIPEPGTALLFGLGLIWMATRRREER